MNLTSDETPVRTISTLGLLCPLPILRTAEAMRTLNANDVIEILSDDPGIVDDLPDWCDETGHELLELELVEVKGHWRALVRKHS